jgi:hypothetical protein
MSRPGIEHGLPPWEASSLEKNHLNSLLIAIRNFYILARECRDMAPPPPPVNVGHESHEPTWTALGCSLNSTCKADGLLLPRRRLASPRILCQTGQITSGLSNSLLMAIRNFFLSVYFINRYLTTT